MVLILFIFKCLLSIYALEWFLQLGRSFYWEFLKKHKSIVSEHPIYHVEPPAFPSEVPVAQPRDPVPETLEQKILIKFYRVKYSLANIMRVLLLLFLNVELIYLIVLDYINLFR